MGKVCRERRLLVRMDGVSGEAAAKDPRAGFEYRPTI